MRPADRSLQSGFTLIELMVALAVLAILAAAAVPSFVEFRERAAIRGAGDQLVSLWANARLEALKRNADVTAVIQTSGTSFCMGATTAATCNCFSANACNAGQYPAEQGDWRGVTLVSTTLGGGSGVAMIDPKRGYLDDDADVGGVTLLSPRGQRYRLRFHVDRWARAYLCSPTNATFPLPGYGSRTCAP